MDHAGLSQSFLSMRSNGVRGVVYDGGRSQSGGHRWNAPDALFWLVIGQKRPVPLYTVILMQRHKHHGLCYPHTDIEQSHQRVSIGGGSYDVCYAKNAPSLVARGTRTATTPVPFEAANNASSNSSRLTVY
uniref:Transposase n=1 Tax=Mesocestoides corti TaxID=53468 RepID=A0A5K3FPA7_MESCO